MLNFGGSRMVWIGLLAIVVACFVGACDKNAGNKAPVADAPKSKGIIAATCLTLSNPFFKTIQDAMVDEAAKEGFDVVYVSGDHDVRKQASQIEDFIVKKVAAIAINPCQSDAIAEPIKKANEAGIPVFTFDIKCKDPAAKVVSHIGTNNFQAGQLAAQAMIEAIGETGGKVAVLDFRAVESCQERVRGFKDVLARYNASREEGKIDLVAELPGDGQTEKGFKVTEDLIQSQPGLAGIFAINDPSALGAVAALEKAGKQDLIPVIGFDGQDEGRVAIHEGKIYADPIQFPEQIGRRTIQAIMDHLAGKEVPSDQPIDSALYRKSDADKEFGSRP